MILLPAIDIRGGRAVRLRRGDFDEETVYAEDPLDAACSFVAAGAPFLPPVDPDGARPGEPRNPPHPQRPTHPPQGAARLGVRLRRGDFDEETVYAEDPLDAACSFVAAGARFLHVVDLDGARQGEPVNLHHLERIRHALEVPVQFGGGLRTIGAIRRALAAGA